MKKNRKIYYILLLCCLFFSCQKDGEGSVPVEQVLLVYLGGDNNLSGESYQKLEAIKSGWNGDNRTKIVIYHDPSDHAPQLLEICFCDKGKRIAKVVRQYAEESSADADVFARVISEVKHLYAAPNYGLLLFSHASGWLPEGTLIKPRSVVIDKGEEMNIADLARAIPDNSFDYIVFEACFMSGIEVAYQLKDKSEYILSSSAEILSPGFTDIYSTHISQLFKGYKGLQSFGERGFAYFNDQTGWMQSATFSIIKTAELQALSEFIVNNCDLSKEIDISTIQHFDRYNYRLFFDFEDYYTRLLKDEKRAVELNRLIGNVVVWKASTPSFMLDYKGFAIHTYSGLTSYIVQSKYPYLSESYELLDWSQSISNQSNQLKNDIKSNGFEKN